MKSVNRICCIVAAIVCCFLLVECLAGCRISSIIWDIKEGAELETLGKEDSREEGEDGTTAGSSDPSDGLPDAPSDETDTAKSDYKISHPELTYHYTEADETAVRTAISELSELIGEGEVGDDVMLQKYAAAEELVYELRAQYQIAYVESYLYKNDGDVTEDYLYISELYNDLVQKFISLYRAIEQSVYRDAFYAGWTEEEIEAVLESADSYDEECADLRAEIDALQREQRALSEDEYAVKSAEIYRKLIAAENTLAKKQGYDGYMDYAYDAVYGRDYTQADAKALVTHAKDSLVNILETTYGRMASVDLSAMDYYVLSEILYGTFEDSYGRSLLDAYYETVGGDIYDIYLDFWESGYYYIAYDEELSEAGAYTFYVDTISEPVIYFGPGYQDVFTFVHEFGHYCAYKLPGNETALSYDLAETQSQGDEWLFLAYLCNDALAGSGAAEYLECYYSANSMLSVLVCLVVNEFEMRAFVSEDGADFDALYKTACDTVYSYEALASWMGYSPEDYWRRVAVENPGYYISYAVSQIPAMEIYVYAAQNFVNGAQMYRTVLSEEGGFLEIIKRAGLSSPFDKTVYERLETAFCGAE